LGVASKAQKQPKTTERRPCTLSVATIRYLEKLALSGTHGSSVPDVMTSLIESGVRQAIKDGFVKMDEPS
jgi:hypothetical protein